MPEKQFVLEFLRHTADITYSRCRWNLNTHHWGIQWNSTVMQVKKATFQRMGSGGNGETENRWDVSGVGQSATPEVNISTISTSRSQQLTVSDDRSVPGDTALLFCKRHQYLVLLYTSNPSRGVNTNCHSPIPCLLPITIRWDLMPCLPNSTASH